MHRGQMLGDEPLCALYPSKGDAEEHYVAGLVADDVEWRGHARIILKFDNEAAIKGMMAKATKIIRAKCGDVESVSREEPPSYSSQSNGGTEVGIRIIRGMFRTLKLCLEARIKKFIPVTHALVPWLLEHVCLLLNVQSRGHDGLTPWQRVRGRPFSQKLLGFGEVVLYKLPTKGPQHNPDGNMGTRWREGVFLGYSRSSCTYILGTPDGKVCSRALMRRPFENRWSEPALAGLRTTPWMEREKQDVQVRFQQDAAELDTPAAPDPPPALRRMRINKSDLEAYGYTQGCKQCEHIERNGKAKGGMQHNLACRTRIIEAIGQTEAGKQRIAEYDERTDAAIAERVEKEDKKLPADTALPSATAPRSSTSSSSNGELQGEDVMSGSSPQAPRAPAATSGDCREHGRVTRDTESRCGGTPVTRHPAADNESRVRSGEAATTDDVIPEHPGDAEMEETQA